MLKENWRLVSRIERLGDFMIIIASFFLAYYTRSSLIFWNDVFGWELNFRGDSLAPLKDYFIVLGVGLAAYMFSLAILGAYSSMRLSSPWQLLRISLLSSGFVFITLAAVLFLLKLDFSRSFVGLFCGYVAILLSAQRFVVLRLLRYWRQRGHNFRNVMICGVGEQAVRIAREIAKRRELGIRVRAFADLAAQDEVRSVVPEYKAFRAAIRKAGQPQTGRIAKGIAGFSRSLEEYAIDEVIFTDIVEVMATVEEALLIAAEQGVRTTIAADLFSIGMVKSGLSYFGGMPLIHFQTPPGDRWELNVKRVIDIIVSAMALILLAPFLLLIALAVWAGSGRPVIFTQTRVGLNGRLFSMYKFRSMRRDAALQQKELLARNEMLGPLFKLKDDPRVPGVGRWLRRYSLDELPQLWNVLRGDMSLVGPRPPVPGEVSLYERRNRRRLSMRPGLTCTWQVSGRNDIKNFESLVALDLDYIDNWSLGRDFLLLMKTIPAVLFANGAR